MADLVRFGVAFDEQLLARLDRHLAEAGHVSRSEFLRDLVRNSLVEEEWQQGRRQVMAALTIIYDHHTRELEERLTGLQHDFSAQIVSTLHVHLDAHDCMEVLVLRGRNHRVRELADRITGMKGVKRGQLTVAKVDGV